MPRLHSTRTLSDGRQLAKFSCGHFILYPRGREHYITYHPCAACEVGRTLEDNKKNILEAAPEAEEYLNERIF